MKLLIFNETRIKDVNKEFRKSFPYLQFVFYRPGNNTAPGSLPEQKLPEHTRLQDISGAITPRFIEIHPSETVCSVEQHFQDDFGLTVQVFRNTGGSWVQTRETRNLSLEKQNAMGSRSSGSIHHNIYTLFL